MLREVSLCDSLVLRGRVPEALDPKHDGRVRAGRDCVVRRGEFLDEFDVRLRVTVEVDRRLAFGLLEAEDNSPHPRVFWLRVADDFAVSLASDVVEYETRKCFQDVRIAIGLAEGHALDLGEVFEPSNAQGADRLVAGIDDHMR